MSGPSVVDLHDRSSLVAADTAGLLPSAALAGAQVRSTADQLAGRPAFDRPRALVVVGAGAAVDAALLTALIGVNSLAPVIAATTLPGWVGPLDIVVVLASAVDDQACAEAAAQAGRRGARVITRAAATGPVAAAAGRDLLDPQVSVTEALAATARLTLLAAVAASAGMYPRPDFTAAAEQLDALAMACHPSSEFFVNPALTLAEHLSTGTPLLIGTDPVADALAAHACRSLAGLAGCAASALSSGQAAGSPPVLARATGRGGAASVDPFWDPYEEGGESGQLISAVLVVGPTAHSAAGPLTGSGLMTVEAVPFGASPSAAGRSPLATALQAALPRAMCIGPEELPERAEVDPGPGPVPPALQRDAFTWTVAMLSRIDFAAVYLGLTAAARAPMDSPDGLGRAGQSANYLPSAGGGPSAWTEREPGSWS